MKITIVLLLVAVVTVTESRPFFLFPLRSIVCDIMCQPPYSDSFCSFCNRSPQQQPQDGNLAQTSATARGNGNANVNAQSSANVRPAGVPRVVPASTTKAPVSAGLNGGSPTSSEPPTSPAATPPAAPAAAPAPTPAPGK